MAATRRLGKELAEINAAQSPTIHNLYTDETNVLNWKLTILPGKPPFDGGFKIQINFPAEYPFKPPKVTFDTKIYHPNIDEKGQICLPIITPENWKPATKTEQVLQALVQLINEPEPEHPLRAELAEEYMKDKKKFKQKAAEFTAKHAEKLTVEQKR